MKDFKATLEEAKRKSMGQVLFKCARLLNERGVKQIRERSGARLRGAHTALFPHIDLEGTRMTELARRLGITKQAVSQMVIELEGMGVLERVPDPSDGRARLVRFARRGEVLLEGLHALGGLEKEIAEHLGEDRYNDLHETLLILLRYLET